MGVSLQGLRPRFTCTDAKADVLWCYDYEKRGIVKVVEGSYFGRLSALIAKMTPYSVKKSQLFWDHNTHHF